MGEVPKQSPTESPPPSLVRAEPPPWTIQPADCRPRRVLKRPFGLPRHIPLSRYRVNPVCALSVYNYKVEAALGPSADSCTRMLTVFDTGAGPNLIRADLLPPGVIKTACQKREIVTLRSASKHRLETMGIVTLTVKIADMTARTPFVVVKQLGADALLGTTFIESHCELMWFRKRKLLLQNGTWVHVQKRMDPRPNASSRPERKDVCTPGQAPDRVHVAARITLPPASETVVKAVTGVMGEMILTSRGPLYMKRQVSMTNGIIRVQKYVPFAVKVANFSETPVTLCKNQILGVAETAPESILCVPTVDDLTRLRDLLEASPAGPHLVAGIETVGKEDTMTARKGSSHPRKPLKKPQRHPEAAGLGTVFREALEQVTPGVHTRIKDDLASPTVDDIDLTHLEPATQEEVRELHKQFEGMWSGHLGAIKAVQHRIPLVSEAKPVALAPRRAGLHDREIVFKEVDRMLRHGVIHEAQSEWAAPVIIVEKQDGSPRFCVDYRRLNALTVKDSYPLPRMEDCLDSPGEAKYFSTLDCNSGYWQIPMAPEDRHKTAFTCHAGCYEFCRMPFGLCNAPATFQRTVDILLAKYRWRSCLAYLDDVIVFSNTLEDHLQHLKEVLTLLQGAGMSLKLRKCNFFAQQVDYLGHVIRPGLLQVAERNTEAVKRFKHPTTQTELRSFLGLCNVYRRFVPNFAHTAAPLNSLLKKGCPYDLPALNEFQIKPFDLLKQALTEPPVLRLPRVGLPFSVDTDACNHQIGCALMQTHDDDARYPIGFWSRSLSPAEKNYSVGEKECLAIVWAVQLLRPYIGREHFDLFTDHQALKWILSGSDNTGRLSRWRLRLLEYDFNVHYKKGAKNTIADAISRLPTFGETEIPPDMEIPCFLVAEESSILSQEGTQQGKGGAGLVLPGDHKGRTVNIVDIFHVQ